MQGWRTDADASIQVPCRSISAAVDYHGCTLASHSCLCTPRRYSSEHMKFGILDVSVFRRICHEMRIDTSFIAKELPALVLFENGKEKARMVNRSPGLFPGPGIRSVVSSLACCSLLGVVAGGLLRCAMPSGTACHQVNRGCCIAQAPRVK
jgi:hypothetical protein